jgi:hypothetical protein
MPVGAYFGGHGESVMADMEKRYPGKAKEMFYKTANKRNQKPKAKAAPKAKLPPRGGMGVGM